LPPAGRRKRPPAPKLKAQAHHSAALRRELQFRLAIVMLEEKPAGWFRTVAMLLAAGVLVVLVFYGLSRPPEPVQVANEPQAAAPAPAATQPPATNGQAQPSQAQPKAERSDSATTGQAAAPSDKPAAPSDKPAAPAK